VITEIGGTVGDIESLPYIESVRQLKWEMGDRVMVIHLTLVPYLSASGELKTKPTQHSVKMLQEEGVQADILVLRTERPLTKDVRRKVALFCNVNERAVIESRDVSTIYEVPLMMAKEGLDEIVLEKLKMSEKHPIDLEPWCNFVKSVKNPKQTVKIGLVGKYVELHDAYKSIAESFIHAGAANNCRVDLQWIHSETLEEGDISQKLSGLKGILVAPGFGHRGIEGKINAARFARENNIPFFGICLGMQCAVIEFGRNQLGLTKANSTEMDPQTPHPVIDLMDDQKEITEKGGTMRLGSYSCRIRKGSRIAHIYHTETVNERHRHRYEFNNAYLDQYKAAGMVPSGINPDTNLVEIMEIPSHKWYIGVQFHPEYRSTVVKPHPLFVSFVKAALE
jgi:CTP synthase